jgi:hypothetical protein
MIRKRTNQEQREAFEELQQRKKRKLENARDRQSLDEDGKTRSRKRRKNKNRKNVRRRGRAKPHKVGSCHNSGNCVDVMCWYAPHYRNYSVEIHAYNRRYSIVAAWAYTIYAVE